MSSCLNDSFIWFGIVLAGVIVVVGCFAIWA
jgi:hypothetical protein